MTLKDIKEMCVGKSEIDIIRHAIIERNFKFREVEFTYYATDSIGKMILENKEQVEKELKCRVKIYKDKHISFFGEDNTTVILEVIE